MAKLWSAPPTPSSAPPTEAAPKPSGNCSPPVPPSADPAANPPSNDGTTSAAARSPNTPSPPDGSPADRAALSPFVPALAIGAGLGLGGLAVLRGTMIVGGIVAFTSWMSILVLWVGVITLRADRTLIVIAHREATIQRLPRNIRLDESALLTHD